MDGEKHGKEVKSWNKGLGNGGLSVFMQKIIGYSASSK